MNLVWLPEAREDIRRLFEFLMTKNPGAAGRAVQTIRKGAAELETLPERGRPMNDDTRRRELLLPFGSSHYVLRYRIDGQSIVIIRVWHQREQKL